MRMERLLLLSQLKDQGQEQNSADKFRQELERCQDQWISFLKNKGFTYIALFRLEQYLFIYLEHSLDRLDFEWLEPQAKYLELWSGKHKPISFVRLMDVFHDGTPANKAAWRTERIVESVHASMQELKPEMVSSYIYYHYLKQEEQPESFNKTYIIGAYQNLLFSYYELPALRSEHPPRGTLDTKNTPENWNEVMQPHFKLETGSDVPWRPMQLWLQMNI